MHSDELATLELPIKDGFITASIIDSTDEYSFYFQPPISNTFVRIEFQLDCVGRCQFSMKQVSYFILQWHYTITMDIIEYLFYATFSLL